jgi:hypothetical protein
MATAKEHWKKVKTEFETNTGKKKPSAKLSGFFRKSAGLEPALDRIDKAKTKEDLKAACNEFSKKKEQYVEVLKANQTDPYNANKTNYKAEIEKMIRGLQEVEKLAFDKLNKMG